jgi:hypothetical protein
MNGNSFSMSISCTSSVFVGVSGCSLLTNGTHFLCCLIVSMTEKKEKTSSRKTKTWKKVTAVVTALQSVTKCFELFAIDRESRSLAVNVRYNLTDPVQMMHLISRICSE